MNRLHALGLWLALKGWVVWIVVALLLVIAVGVCTQRPPIQTIATDPHQATIDSLKADTLRLSLAIAAKDSDLINTRDSLVELMEKAALRDDSLEALADEYSAWEDARKALVRPRVERQGGTHPTTVDTASVVSTSHDSSADRATGTPPVDAGSLIRGLGDALKSADARVESMRVFADSVIADKRVAIDSVKALDNRLMAAKDAQLRERDQTIAKLTASPGLFARVFDEIKYPVVFIAGVVVGARATR